MGNNKHTPTTYFFDSKKWAENFKSTERNTSRLYSDGLIIGSLLREVDEKCAKLIEALNGFSEHEILTYQQVMVIALLLDIRNGKFTGNPDPILEAIHESSQLCIKISTSKFSEYNPQKAYLDLYNLAHNRIYLENQWQKVTKSNWYFKRDGIELTLSPSEREVDFGEKIAVQRFRDHLLQLLQVAIHDGGFVDPKIKSLPSDIFNVNNRFGVNYSSPSKESAIQHQLILNQYPYYYMDYSHIPLKSYPKLTLLDVRYFWIVFSSMSECIINTLSTGGDVHLPVIFSKEELVSILTRCIDINTCQAEQLVELHTNMKSELADFYLKPIYKVSDSYYISLGVFISGQTTRVIDEVVKTQLNIKELEKGKLFEKHFKRIISDQISNNKILQNGFCRVLSLGFKQSKGRQNEEIDLIIRIGETYLLIEAKSFIYRTGVTGFHNNLNELKGSNAKQKVNFFISEYGRFKEIYDQEAKFDLKLENVIFCYLTSVPHATGIKVNGMPVVDSSILERYFGQGNFELRNKKNESKIFKFYDNFKEAEVNLRRYLNSPPQLQRFQNSFGYVKSDNVMKLNGININFQEALFNLNKEQDAQVVSYLWSLADSWHR
ncbi:hypothetical protein ABQ366_12595 [Serratia fonticola]|uniref:hypothetical protein n=1 Tax=Serratia fonticola TaxID=47917 RepID=UPI003AADFCD2